MVYGYLRRNTRLDFFRLPAFPRSIMMPPIVKMLGHDFQLVRFLVTDSVHNIKINIKYVKPSDTTDKLIMIKRGLILTVPMI